MSGEVTSSSERLATLGVLAGVYTGYSVLVLVFLAVYVPVPVPVLVLSL